MSNATTATSKAGPREWIGLAVLTLPALLVSMDLSVLFMAVPWLSADLCRRAVGTTTSHRACFA